MACGLCKTRKRNKRGPAGAGGGSAAHTGRIEAGAVLAERWGQGRRLDSKVAGTKPAATKKTRTATPKAIRARKLQGQYMGALKSLKGANRAKVKAVAKEKGVAVAVKLALGMKKGK